MGSGAVVIITEITCAIIAAAALVIVAVVETGNKRRRKSEEIRRERREKEMRLSMELMSASVELSYVTSLAVTGGKTNGNVKKAQEKAEKAQEAYEDFLKTEVAHAVAK